MCCFDPLDVMFRLERAFGIRLKREDSLPKPAEGVRLFRLRTRVGELYELVTKKRKELPRREPKADLFQTALTEIREALASVLERAPDSIRPDDRLEELLPRGPRRGLWRRLGRRLGKQELPWLHPQGGWYPIVWWIGFLVSALVAAGLLGMVSLLCSWSIRPTIVVVAFLLLVWLLLGLVVTNWILSWRCWPIREFPYGIVTVRDLAQVVLALNRHHYVEVCEGDPDDDVWTSLRVIAAYLTGLELEEVTEQTDLAAPSVSSEPSDERVFRCPAFVRFILGVAAVVFSTATALVVVLSPIALIMDPPATRAGGLLVIAIMVAGGSFFGGLFLWSLSNLRHASTTLRIDRHGITRTSPRDGETSLAWTEVERIVERAPGWLDLRVFSLDLHGLGGQVVLSVDQELERFKQLMSIIMEKTDWQRLLRPSYANPEWPVHFHSFPARPRPVLRFCLAAVIIGGFTGLLLLTRSVALGAVGIAGAGSFVLLALRIWHRLELDPAKLRFCYLWGQREVKISEIRDVSIDFVPFLQVQLTLADGRRKVIVGAREGGLAVAQAIDAARRKLRTT